MWTISTPSLAALNAPPPAPAAPVKPDVPSSATADRDAVLAPVKRYSQAFEQRDPDALRVISRNMGKNTLDLKTHLKTRPSIKTGPNGKRQLRSHGNSAMPGS